MPIEFEYIEDTSPEEEDEDTDEEEIEEEEVEEEIEEIEFGMTDEEIDEWINELILLKSERESINLQIDENLFLKIKNLDSEVEEE